LDNLSLVNGNSTIICINMGRDCLVAPPFNVPLNQSDWPVSCRHLCCNIRRAEVLAPNVSWLGKRHAVAGLWSCKSILSATVSLWGYNQQAPHVDFKEADMQLSITAALEGLPVQSWMCPRASQERRTGSLSLREVFWCERGRMPPQEVPVSQGRSTETLSKLDPGIVI